MPQKWNIERETLAFLGSIVLCVLLAISSAGRGWTRSAMDAFAGVISWAEVPAVSVIKNVAGMQRWAAERRGLLMELARLREDNRSLRLALGQKEADEIARSAREGNLFPVVFRDPRLWWEAARIRTESASAVPGSAVLDGADLVGMVTSSDQGGAWVHLITSADFYAPVVLERTREVGVISGDGNGGVWLRFLPDGEYKPGTKIFTAMGGTLPYGLPVGEIWNEVRDFLPGSREYRVKPGADLFRLQYVYTDGGRTN